MFLNDRFGLPVSLMFASLVTVSVAGGQNPKGVADAKIVPPSWAGFVDDLRECEGRIKTLKVIQQVKKTSTVPQILIEQFNVPVVETRSSGTEQWSLYTDGRGRCEIREEAVESKRDGGAEDYRSTIRSVFDGRAGLFWSVEERAGRAPRHQAMTTNRLTARNLSPLDFSIRSSGRLISEVLEERGGEFVGEETWDGHQVLVVRTKPIAPGSGSAEKVIELWIATDRGMTVVRQRLLSRHVDPLDDGFGVARSIDCFGHKEVAESVWMPTIVTYREFDVRQGDPTDELRMRMNVVCRDWQINQPIQNDALKMALPPGVRIEGALDKFEKQLVVRDNFFVRPATTPLHRKLLGDVAAYAEIDVASFVDINTQQITPAAINWQEFERKLRAIPNDAGKGKLFLKFEFGGLPADELLGDFVEPPLKAIARRCGFKNVRTSRTYGQAIPWEPPGDGNDQALEEDLGPEFLGVFQVQTSISRRVLGQWDYLIQPSGFVDEKADKLFSGPQIRAMEEVFDRRHPAGRSVLVKLVVGDPNAAVQGNPRLPHVRESSDLQKQAVRQLRDLGFGDIRIQCRNGFQVFNSDHAMPDEVPQGQE